MKNFFFAILILFLPDCLFAQDIIERTNVVNGALTEKFHVLKSDKKVKHGGYELYFKSKIAGKGEYKNGQKTGEWTYYFDGELIQKYNYDTETLTYNRPDPSLSYKIDGATQADLVAYPIKLGGKEAGYYLLLHSFNYPDFIAMIRGKATSNPVLINHWFYLDQTGKLINWESKVTIADEVKSYKQNIKNIPGDYAGFLPASVNGNKVPSIVIYQSELYRASGITSTTERIPR